MTQRLEIAEAKLAGASSTEQARIVAGLGVESAMLVAILVDDLTAKIVPLDGAQQAEAE